MNQEVAAMEEEDDDMINDYDSARPGYNSNRSSFVSKSKPVSNISKLNAGKSQSKKSSAENNKVAPTSPKTA